MASGPVRVERRGGVAWCTLDRPPLNLIDPGLIAALRDTVAALARDPDVRVGVLAGAGRAFTAGMDVRVLRDLDAAGARTLIGALHDAIDAVYRAPFPVIAAVQGACLGAGFELALACDLRVAAADAVFGLPEVRVGVPSVIHAALLPPLLGAGRAAELLLLGETLEARRALEWGMVNEVVPGERLRAAAEAMVAKLLACGPTAIRLQKELIVRWRERELTEAIRLSLDVFATAYGTAEPREGATAFLEKRPPRFGSPA